MRTFGTEIKELRKQWDNFVWIAEMYCRNSQCDVREVRVRAKEHRGETPSVPALLICPACHGELSLHGVCEQDDWRLSEEFKAQCVSRVLRYKQEHGDEDGAVLIPASVYAGDEGDDSCGG